MNEVFEDEAQAKAQGIDVYEGLPFVIERIRPARLSDFLQFSRFWGDLREAMAQHVGDDSLLDDGHAISKIADTLRLRIAEAMDSAAQELGLPVSDLTIVESRRVVLPEIG